MEATTPHALRASVLPALEHIDEVIKMLTDKIQDEGTPEGNMDLLRSYAADVESVRKMRAAISHATESVIDVMTSNLGFSDDTVALSTNHLRTIYIEVSEGMLNQNLLTMTTARRDGQVRLGEKFHITLPDGHEFETELCEPGARLRERGAIRYFYELTHTKPGDTVVLAETARGQWKLHASDHIPGSLEDYLTELSKDRLK